MFSSRLNLSSNTFLKKGFRAVVNFRQIANIFVVMSFVTLFTDLL